MGRADYWEDVHYIADLIDGHDVSEARSIVSQLYAEDIDPRDATADEISEAWAEAIDLGDIEPARDDDNDRGDPPDVFDDLDSWIEWYDEFTDFDAIDEYEMTPEYEET
jgi:hypothetical protein